MLVLIKIKFAKRYVKKVTRYQIIQKPERVQPGIPSQHNRNTFSYNHDQFFGGP